MALAHDKDGFLIGEPVKANRESFTKAMQVWNAIKSDTGAIRASLGKQADVMRRVVATPGNAANSSSFASSVARQVAAANRARDGLGRFVATPKSSEQSRDARGRFGSGGSGGSGGGGAERPSGPPVTPRASRRKRSGGMGYGVVEGAKDLAHGTENIDPTFAAAKEVAGLARPFAKVGKTVFGRLFGKKDEAQKGADATAKKTVPWFKRMLVELRTLNKKSGGAGVGSGGLMGLIGGPLMRLAPALSGMVATAAGAVLPRLASAAGFAAKSVLPVAAIISAVKSFGTSTEDYGKRMGVETGDSLLKDTAVRAAGVMQDLGNTLTFGLADKLGKAIAPTVLDFASSVSKTVARAGTWFLGQTSKFFESGKKGAGAVSSGKGDNGGASYGTYQLSSSKGRVQEFLAGSKYGAAFEGLTPGSPEFNARWKQVAKQDPSFGDAQHDFIKRTHFDPQMSMLAKGGIDLSSRGPAVQDAVWSTSVQFGPESQLIRRALNGRNAASMSDAELVSAIQDYKVKNNDRLFSRSSSGVRAGTLTRAKQEGARLRALASTGLSSARSWNSASFLSTQSAGLPMGVMAIPPAPLAPASQINSGAEKLEVSVVMPAEVGQNVGDRGIAQIATGGLGGRG